MMEDVTVVSFITLTKRNVLDSTVDAFHVSTNSNATVMFGNAGKVDVSTSKEVEYPEAVACIVGEETVMTGAQTHP